MKTLRNRAVFAGKSAAALCAVVIAAAVLAMLGPAMASPTGSKGSSARVPLFHRPPFASDSEPGPSSVIFPIQRIPLHFDHQKHAKGLALSCTTCHENAQTSGVSSDDLFPRPAVCDRCHDSDHADLNSVRSRGAEPSCDLCHVGHRPEHGNRVEKVVTPPPNLRFDHRAHARRNINCRQCHGEVQEIGLATRDQLPRMRACFGCHALPSSSRGDAQGECRVCHLSAGGRLRTAFASGTLVPPAWLHAADHGPDWIERHKAAAAANSAFCASCHAEQECVDCHDGRVRPRRIHPNDWLNLHVMAARQNAPSCGSCHRSQSFCLTCHERSGVTWSGPLANTAHRGRVHPPRSVWTDLPRTQAHHAWEAQRNMDACVSCHTERDCALCHAAAAVGGGLARPTDPTRGVAPHPPGFSAGACRSAYRKNPRPCLVCHGPNDPQLSRCR